MHRFLGELRRRHVPQTVAVYLVAAWAVIQFSDIIVPNLGWPQSVVTAVIIAAAIGLPVVIVLAWIFDWGPDGLHRTGSDRVAGMAREDMATSAPWVVAVGVLVVAVGGAVAVATLLGDDGAEPDPSAEAASDQAGDFPAPPSPPSIVGAEFADSILQGLAPILGEAAMDSIMEEAGRVSVGSVDRNVEILTPFTWRFGPITPADPGDSIHVRGIARHEDGVLAVEVDGRVVAETEEPVPALEFETWVVAPTDRAPGDQVGVSVVVRTPSGEVGRGLALVLRPGD